ncbi:MAG: ureidoglycolate hydrolase [Christensenella sp.]
MRKIKAQKLTKEAFAPYGAYTDLLAPEGYSMGAFYPDRLMMPAAGDMQIAFSPLLAEKPDKYIVSTAEYHNSTCECILALDGDVIVHVAPPSNAPVPELTEAFIVPKGTMVRLDLGVWHLGPMAIDGDCHIMIALPQRIYMNDCIVIDYAEKDFVEIEL